LNRRPFTATYRVQLHAGFTFDDAASITDYLHDLGVSHLFCSPYLQAAPGSTHGYDVVDHHHVNVELGGEDGHRRLCDALGRAGLGQVLDVVPNHMAITGRENQWWWDVLENGPSSVYASYFDVDWNPPETKLRNTVLMPILGDHYGRVLEAGQLTVRRDGGSFIVRYFDHELPAAPRSLDTLLGAAAARVDSAELESIATAFGRLPPSWATDRESVRERHRDKEVLKAGLARLCEEGPEVAAAIDQEVAALNADFDQLDAFLERQNYRLAFWRTGDRELDYRRFFNITSLIGLRIEDPQVFEDTHELVLQWVREGVLDGLRIDHPDGLLDPEEYLERLAKASDHRWVVVEKILEPGEQLRERWPVAGTTGYDFLNRVGGLFVDPGGEAPLTAGYAEATGMPVDYEEIVVEKKHLVMQTVLAADVNRLTELFVHVCEGNRRFRDFTRHELHEVLRETIAQFPVYRTYVRARERQVDPVDVAYVDHAIERARDRRPDLDADLFSFLADVLLLRTAQPDGLEGELATRFQQVTGPVMAKGVEDTTFYTFTRLLSLNEVGSDPSRFGTSLSEFHTESAAAAQRWPDAMLTTSTHDTKRSEDVRARISLLSEMADRWVDTVRRWMAMNESHKSNGWPDANAEWLLYQTLVGAWPLPVDRAVAFMEKASKEAKDHTSWTDPVAEYDDALRSFVEAVLADESFIADLERFVAPLVAPGRINSLAQKLITLTAPGVPDLYQGTDLWDLSLVDPDNRRPVDYELRKRLLGELAALSPEEIVARMDEGLPKLHVVQATLAARARLGADLGGYEPLDGGDGVVAFHRTAGLVTVTPRLVLGEGWREASVLLPDGPWRNVFTGDEVKGGEVAVSELLHRFPVALLERA
jgi:(1->4)-alpha-D-glucan 1-alpha-D-glucosylmutase